MDAQPRPPDDTPPAPGAVAPSDPDLACRLANVEWAIVASRLPWRSHVERIHDLEAAGMICDEAYFAAQAAA